MEELAQSVGNEKMPGEFDWDAATDVDLNANDSGPLGSIPALGHEEALSLLFQKIVTASPWAEESFSDALSRAYTIV